MGELLSGRTLALRTCVRAPVSLRAGTHELRIDGIQAKGYFQEDFTDVFRRYIPRSEIKSLLADSLPDSAPASPSEPANPPSRGS